MNTHAKKRGHNLHVSIRHCWCAHWCSHSCSNPFKGSRLCSSLPNSTFSDATLAMWEYLYYENRLRLQIRNFYFLPNWFLNISYHITSYLPSFWHLLPLSSINDTHLLYAQLHLGPESLLTLAVSLWTISSPPASGP